MTKVSFTKLLWQWLINGLGVALAAHLIQGIEYRDAGTLLLVVALMACFNLILKPLLVLVALPFVILTLGLGLWLINATLLYLSGYLLANAGFTVASFWDALLGALVISLTAFLANLLFTPRRVRVRVSQGASVVPPPEPEPKPIPGRMPRSTPRQDVIDV